MAVKWLDAPEDRDYDDAAAEPLLHEAKDVLRAARLTLLPATTLRVESDIAKIEAGKKLPPILLVRREVADGYQRICASYLTDENTPVACCLVSWG